jgi:hypothetical protein
MYSLCALLTKNTELLRVKNRSPFFLRFLHFCAARGRSRCHGSDESATLLGANLVATPGGEAQGIGDEAKRRRELMRTMMMMMNSSSSNSHSNRSFGYCEA